MMRLLTRGDSLVRCSIIVLGVLITSTSVALAGGGPENVALIVNRDSWMSLTVANQYRQLRQIPARNVIYLAGDGFERNVISIDDFRDKILIPVMNEVSRRGLDSQIDYVVYSAGFPFAVNVQPDLEGGSDAPKLPRHITKQASINGLTFLYQSVLAKDWQSYLSLQSNTYSKAQARGFRARDGWSTEGTPVGPTEGRRYVLSTVLAVTRGRGNSMDEVSRYLTRAALADASKPKGTIYLMENSNVRSKTRAWAFRKTKHELGRLGVDALIERGKIPVKHDDVLGAVVGTATFDWKSSESSIVPGAICEHLTSYGGNLRAGATQTPLTEFLRFGAAGSSGTVTEPYAIQAKFPTALMHVSYASGCSLAESFYQSVAGPYQLLIVGDPLCQPWAERPQVSVQGIEAGQSLRGQGVISVSATAAPGVRRVELFLDGKRISEHPAQFSLPVDSRSLWNGPHELRVVAIAADDVETQGRKIIPFQVNNGPAGEQGNEDSGAAVRQANVQYGSDLQVVGAVRGADYVGVLSGDRMLGRIDPTSGVARVPTTMLGAGEFTLRIVGYQKNKEISETRVAVAVQPRTAKPLAVAPDKEKLQRGLLLETTDESQVITSLSDSATELTRNKPYTVRAFYRAATSGTYQLQLRSTDGISSFHVNDFIVHPKKKAAFASYPVDLKAGWYELRLIGKSPNGKLPDIRLGQANILPLSKEQLWCQE